jgi:N utilization substance protein B
MEVVQELYSLTFVKQPKIKEKTKKVIANSENLDKIIQKFAPKFPIDNIAKVDLAILKLAAYELIIEKKEPPKVIINEAVELAREMGSGKAYSFVNAVLGKIYESISKS